MEASSRKAFTLIELIVTIAILMITVAAFLSLFAFGFKTVIQGGDKTKIGFNSQEAAEQIIAGMTLPSESPAETSIPVSTTLTVNLNSPGPVNISGNDFEIVANEKDQTIVVDVFVPNPNVYSGG